MKTDNVLVPRGTLQILACHANNWAAEIDSHGDEIAAKRAREQVVIARSILMEEDASNDWQPIATAPRDGTKIMLFGPGFGTMIGRYDWEQGHNPDHWRVMGNRYEIGDFTHWRPLPPPPG